MSQKPKHYISDIPELIAEWNWEKNNELGLDPSKIATGDSRTKVWWRCEYGHEWQTVPNSRKGGARCPKCVDESRTSFPEQAIFFYLKQLTTAYNRYQLQSNLEIDVYLPEFKIGIEYDGFYYHNNQRTIQKEQQKDQYCLQSGIALIRIKEVKDSKIIKREQNIIYCHYRHPGSSLSETINALLEYIELLTIKSFNIDVDIERDRSIIYNQYIYIRKNKTLFNIHIQKSVNIGIMIKTKDCNLIYLVMVVRKKYGGNAHVVVMNGRHKLLIRLRVIRVQNALHVKIFSIVFHLNVHI